MMYVFWSSYLPISEGKTFQQCYVIARTNMCLHKGPDHLLPISIYDLQSTLSQKMKNLCWAQNNFRQGFRLGILNFFHNIIYRSIIEKQIISS